MKLTKKLIILTIILTVVINSIIFITPQKAANNLYITVTADNSEYGSVLVDWSGYDYNNKVFKVFSSANGTPYETVGIDYKSVNEVKCLQVYPIDAAANQMKTWMETNGYGKGIIKVDSVYIDTFNANPYAYLKDENGNWKYDVAFFGTWDSNNGKDLSAASAAATEAFIKAGKGVIVGHDTIGYATGFNHPYFNSLNPYFNITLNSNWSNGYNNSDTKVVIKKVGLFTRYPWYIGDIGTVLTIPTAHNLGQTANGNIWLSFNNTVLTGNYNFYLTTNNNCAQIMTGHSSGAATDDEQKIIANLIFYENQLRVDTHKTLDIAAQDTIAPTNPVVTSNEYNFNFSSTDRGVTYSYYVESYSKDDTTATGLIDRSNVVEDTVITGLKEYRYIFDNNANTVVTLTNGTATNKNSIPFSRNNSYLHVAAVDGAGNVSGTTTVSIATYSDYKVIDNLQNLDGTTYTVAKEATKVALIGTKLTIIPNVYEGFTTPSAQTVTVESGNKTVVNYYYTRNKYNLAVGTSEGIDSVSGAGTYYYGQTVRINAVVNTRYAWRRWTGSEEVSEQEYELVIPAKDINYTATAILKTQLEVKYIDQNTNEEISRSIVYNGLLGDTYDVSSDRKEIPGYTLLQEPSKTGTMDKAETTLTYYYAKSANVTAKYIEQDSGIELESREITNGYESLIYGTESKEIPGYTLVATVGTEDGIIGREDIEVNYYYLKDSSVEVKYIDKNNNEEIEEHKVYEGLYGDVYDVSIDQKEIPGYTLISMPEKVGTMEKTPKVLTYYYAKNTQVTVNYIEQDSGTRLESTIIIPGYETEEYTTEIKEIPGYTLVQTAGKIEGEMPREASEVNYYYLKDTNITVKYIDKNNGEEISEEKVYEGLYNYPFDIRGDKKAIPGYTLIQEPVKTGKMSKEPITLTYYYAKNAGVTVKYIEQDSGKELEQTIEKQGYETLGYTTEAKEIEGYTLVETIGQARGKMTREVIEVVYYYLKDTSVTVKYIDQNTGEELLENIVYEGLYGDDFDIRGDKQNITGYTLIEEPEKVGTMEKEPITLTYYYAKTTEVTVKYIEQDSGIELEETIIKPGYEALTYETEQKEIPGYTLVETTGMLNGKMPREASEVVYYYLKDTSVTVKYIDKNTGEKLLENIVYEGLYGDSYDVSVDKKEISEFTLLEEPEYTGTMEKEPLILTYYYAKTTNVTVKYIEEDSGIELEQTIVKPGYEALPYETEAKEIEGYTLVETTGMLNGKMPREASEVLYYYLKDTSVTVKYIDKNTGDELLENKVYEGLYGDLYDVSGDKQEISEFTLIEEPEYTGTMEKEPLTLTYYYLKNTSVTVKYIEKDSEIELEETIIKPGYETLEYTTERKEIPGYTLVETTGMLNGYMSREASEVVYYYLKNTGVTVKYIDKNTGEELSEEIVHGGLYGDSYDVSEDKQEISEFTLLEEPEYTGTMGKEPITLTYYYAKTQKVTVKYIEKDSGEELAKSEIIGGYESKKYSTEEKQINDYTLVSIIGIHEGKMPRKDLTVVYYYLKNTGVTVKYIDKNTGEEIAESNTHKGLYSDSYDIRKDEKGINGYTLIESPIKLGRYEKEEKELVYCYAKDTSVTVKYLDKNSGEELNPTIVIKGYEGKKYETEAKKIAKYLLVKTEGKVSGNMEREESTVTYYYLKDVSVTIKYVDQNTNKEIEREKVYKGLYGDSYNISGDKKVIPGYTLIEEPEETGIMDQEVKELTYYYVKNSEIKVRYIEEKTGKEIALMKIISGYEGKKYKENALEIEGYTLVTTPTSFEGVMDRNSKEINFYYLKNTSVKVQYIDKKTGEEIAETVVYEGLDGEYYDISKDKKEIEGYKLIEEPKTTGNMEENEIILTYYYVENKTVKIRFIDMHPEENLVATGETNEEIIVESEATEIEIPVEEITETQEIKIKITNEKKEVEKTTIVAKIPEGVTIKPKENSEWKIEKTVATLEITELNPLEEKEYTLVYEAKEEQNTGIILAVTTGIVLTITGTAVIIKKKH